MSPREHDPDVRDLISAGDTLHDQLARLDRSEPPEELDRIVIERARQAIRAPQSERPIRQFRWAVPLAVAATLVLSFALVLHQIGPPSPAAVSPPAPVVAQARVEEAPRSVRADAAENPAPAAPPLAAISREAPPDLATEATAPAESPARTRVVPDAALAKRAPFERRVVASSGAAMEGAASDSAATASAATKTELRTDPNAWMAYIARLRHVGRSDEADREYAEFRRLYPSYKYSAPSQQAAEAIAPNR
jgi:hypothetical protein